MVSREFGEISIWAFLWRVSFIFCCAKNVFQLCWFCLSFAILDFSKCSLFVGEVRKEASVPGIWFGTIRKTILGKSRNKHQSLLHRYTFFFNDYTIFLEHGLLSCINDSCVLLERRSFSFSNFPESCLGSKIFHLDFRSLKGPSD